MFFDFFFFNLWKQSLSKKKKKIKMKQVSKSFSIISESPYSTFYARSVTSGNYNKTVSHHFKIHENTAFDNVLNKKTSQLL